MNTEHSRELQISKARSQRIISLWNNVLQLLQEETGQEDVKIPAAFKIYAFANGSLHLEPFEIPSGIVMVPQKNESAAPTTPTVLPEAPVRQYIPDPPSEAPASTPPINDSRSKRRTLIMTDEEVLDVLPPEKTQE